MKIFSFLFGVSENCITFAIQTNYKQLKTKAMRKWTDIEEIKAGDIVLRSNGLKASPSQIEVLSIEVKESYAIMTWKWVGSTDSYYSTDFSKSKNIADYGFWHDLTSQQWTLNN